MTHTTEREALAREWHALSDHARDGSPFGGYLCNCEQQAARVEAIVAARLAERDHTLIAIRALHFRCGPDGPTPQPMEGYCHECVLPWPCATAVVLDGQAPTQATEEEARPHDWKCPACYDGLPCVDRLGPVPARDTDEETHQ